MAKLSQRARSRSQPWSPSARGLSKHAEAAGISKQLLSFIVAVDKEGKTREIRFTAKAVQDLIYAVADAGRQGEREPIDWKEFPQPFYWPRIGRQWTPQSPKKSEV